ncbi:MAG: NADH-quinone oxidoreductase subunit J [Pseudobdellovibrionaceae bacterium]
MTADTLIFWILALATLASGAAVILIANPIYCALALAVSMIGIAALFVTLNAYFLAGVQLIVYAGAVMVLFVMVLMLFDLKKELKAFSRGVLTGAIKLTVVGVLAGLIAGSIYLSTRSMPPSQIVPTAAGVEATKNLGIMLFTQYVLGFEVLGVLLTVVAVGAVALSRSKGGTHAKH